MVGTGARPDAAPLGIAVTPDERLREVHLGKLQGLGVDFVNARKVQLAKVTRADVARVARTLLSTDDLSIAIAGQPLNIDR
jgi:predicted Zn-dependent peptidase